MDRAKDTERGCLCLVSSGVACQADCGAQRGAARAQLISAVVRTAVEAFHLSPALSALLQPLNGPSPERVALQQEQLGQHRSTGRWAGQQLDRAIQALQALRRAAGAVVRTRTDEQEERP